MVTLTTLPDLKIKTNIMETIYGKFSVSIPNIFFTEEYLSFRPVSIIVNYLATQGNIDLQTIEVPFVATDIIDWSKPLLKPYLMDAARNNLNTTLEELEERSENVVLQRQ